MTYSQWFVQLSFVWAVIGFVLLLIAWRSAAQGNTHRHRQLMLILVTGAWIFVAAYILLRYHLPDQLTTGARNYIPWLIIHGSIGMLAVIGASTLVLARMRQRYYPSSKLHVNQYHRIYGRIIIVLWIFTHAGGIVNYWMFF